jgi:hypothetical protein
VRVIAMLVLVLVLVVLAVAVAVVMTVLMTTVVRLAGRALLAHHRSPLPERGSARQT